MNILSSLLSGLTGLLSFGVMGFALALVYLSWRLFNRLSSQNDPDPGNLRNARFFLICTIVILILAVLLNVFTHLLKPEVEEPTAANVEIHLYPSPLGVDESLEGVRFVTETQDQLPLDRYGKTTLNLLDDSENLTSKKLTVDVQDLVDAIRRYERDQIRHNSKVPETGLPDLPLP